MKPEDYRKYLFEYYHDGDWWSLAIPAASEDDAIARVNQLQYAKYLGRVEAEIPASMGGGIVAKALCFVRNALRT